MQQQKQDISPKSKVSHSTTQKKNQSHEEKLRLRFEFEFERINEDLREVLDVEEIRAKQEKIMKPYCVHHDNFWTTAHLKAGRKIAKVIYYMRERKLLSKEEKVA